MCDLSEQIELEALEDSLKQDPNKNWVEIALYSAFNAYYKYPTTEVKNEKD